MRAIVKLTTSNQRRTYSGEEINPSVDAQGFLRIAAGGETVALFPPGHWQFVEIDSKNKKEEEGKG